MFLSRAAVNSSHTTRRVQMQKNLATRKSGATHSGIAKELMDLTAVSTEDRSAASGLLGNASNSTGPNVSGGVRGRAEGGGAGRCSSRGGLAGSSDAVCRVAHLKPTPTDGE